MTSTDHPAPPPAPAGGETAAMADQITMHHGSQAGGLVIAARTQNGSYRTYGGENLGPVRAAVAVAVAAGNSRLWDGASGTTIVEQPVRALPEVIRSAAHASGFETAYVGCIEDTSVAAVAVWFEVDGTVATPAQRLEVMQLLEEAASRQAEVFRQRDEAAAAEAAAETAAAEAKRRSRLVREFDPDDPRLDASTGLATRAEFERALDSFDADEATLIVVDIDAFSELVELFDAPSMEGVARAVADRLVSTCRASDLIARLGDRSFAILLNDASRSVGLQVAKRLLDTIAEPLDLDRGPTAVTATVALAHQFGLVDMEELVESADEAVATRARAGNGRLVIAS